MRCMASTVDGSGAGPPAAVAAEIRSPVLLKTWLATVLSVASPSAPPTCCMVLSTPEPMPESSARTWCTAVRVTGTNVRPMPSDIRMMPGRMSVT